MFSGILQATGVPLPHLMAWVTITTEIVCGIAFLLGTFIDLVSIPASCLQLRSSRSTCHMASFRSS